MTAFSQTILTLSTVANIRRRTSIAVALCLGITICLTGIANAETVTYSWTGTIVSVAVDDGTGIYTGTQIGDTFSGTFTYDPDVANINWLVTSDGDSIIEPGDVWVEYFPGSASATFTDGTTQLIGSEGDLSITTDIPIDDPEDQEAVFNLFGKVVPLGTLVDAWGLSSGDLVGNVEFEVEYVSLINMQDDLTFRPTPPWSPPGSPDDPDNQIAIFNIFEIDDPMTWNEIFSAYGIITIAQVQQSDSVASLADLNSNGSPEVAVLIPGANNRVHVRDGSTDALLSDIDFGTDPAYGILVVPDLGDAGSDAEIALLGERPTGQIRVQVKDSATGSSVKNLFYGSQYSGLDMALVSDYGGGGLPELAVLGVNASNGIRVQTRDIATDTFLDNLFLGSQTTAKSVASVSDVSGNGLPEIGMLSVVNASSQARLQVLDADTGVFYTNVWYGNIYTPVELITMPTINGGSAEEFVGLGINEVTGGVRVQIRDSGTAAILTNMFLGSANVPVDLAVVSDNNGNGFPEIAVLMETPAGNGIVKVHDSNTGLFIRNVFFNGLIDPVGIVTLPNYAGGPGDEIAVLGTNGGVKRVQIKDSGTNAQVNAISFPE